MPLSTGMVTHPWKNSDVMLMHKNNIKTTEPAFYRPVSPAIGVSCLVLK